MANVVRKMYRYLSASANRKIDEKADPRVQIEQAIDEAQKQHRALVQNAAAVVGRQRQLEMRMARQIDDVRNLTESARQALRLSDDARLAGDAATAHRYEQTAQTLAAKLVTSESSLEDMKGLHVQASAAAEQAKRAVEDNSARLEEMLDERTRLLTQIEHTAMQEQVAKSLEAMSPLAPKGDTPTLAEVRDKIEKRQALALGRHELASQGMEARMLEVRRATLDARASDRLAALRRELPPAAASAHADATGTRTGSGPASVEGGHPVELTKGSPSGGAPSPAGGHPAELTKGSTAEGTAGAPGASRPAGGTGGTAGTAGPSGAQGPAASDDLPQAEQT
jgi:phage shock protein A